MSSLTMEIDMSVNENVQMSQLPDGIIVHSNETERYHRLYER